MTEQQKNVFREIRKIRMEPIIVVRNFFFLLLLFLLISFAMLSSEKRSVDVFTVLKIMSGIYVVLVAAILVVRFYADSRFISKLGERDAACVLDEIADGRTMRSIKTILTRNYLLGINVGMFVIPIEDILLIYKKQDNINFIPSRVELIVKTRSAQEFSIAACSFYSRKNRRLHDELVQALYEKNSHILFGYNDENLYAYQKETVPNRK